MKCLNSLLLPVFLFLLCSPARAGDFKVAGMTFAGPREFISVKPKSFMRKAQLRVGADAAEGEVLQDLAGRPRVVVARRGGD